MRKLLRRLLTEAVPRIQRKFTCQQPEYAGFEVGFGTYGSPRILMDYPNEAKLTIGKYCSIAGNVWILLGAEHRLDWVTTYPFDQLFEEFKTCADSHKTKGDVVVGNDVWIGMNAVILSGVKIGDGAVVGAGTVVSRNVPPYAVVAGNPFNIIKYRFVPEVVEQLLELKWWDWTFEEIKRYRHLLLSGDIEELMERCERAKFSSVKVFHRERKKLSQQTREPSGEVPLCVNQI